jgi:hypothetical protein
LSAFVSHQSSSFPISLDDRFHGSDPFPIEANRQAIESLCEMKKGKAIEKVVALSDVVTRSVACYSFTVEDFHLLLFAQSPGALPCFILRFVRAPEVEILRQLSGSRISIITTVAARLLVSEELYRHQVISFLPAHAKGSASKKQNDLQF